MLHTSGKTLSAEGGAISFFACSYVACLPSDYAFPYIILVLSLVTLAVYMSASEVEVGEHVSYVKTQSKKDLSEQSPLCFLPVLRGVFYI